MQSGKDESKEQAEQREQDEKVISYLKMSREEKQTMLQQKYDEYLKSLDDLVKKAEL